MLFCILPKVAGVDLRVLSISSVITQMIAVMLLPIICLLVFRKGYRFAFRIRHTYLLLLLCIMYCVFFVVHQQFNMPGFYLFIQDLIIIGFSEEYLYRGVMYSIMKKEYSFGNCIEQFIRESHTCRISNGSGWW